MPATIVDGVLQSTDAPATPPSVDVDALRLEALTLTKQGDSSGVAESLKAAVKHIDLFLTDLAAAEKSGLLTAAGLRERRKSLGAPLVNEAEAMERQAAVVESIVQTSFDAEWSKIVAPVTDAQYPRFADLARRVEGEDPVIFEQLMLAAARDGHFDLIRAVVTLLAPPITISKEQKWRNPVNADLLSKIKDAVRERVSPQGPQAWKAMRLRGLAKQLRATVGL